MVKKGPGRHLRRYAVPRAVKLPRKSFPWAVKPGPGPHPSDRSLPLSLLLRDTLGLTSTLSEAKKVLAGRKVLVDGRVRTDHRFPVGLMDLVSLPSLGTSFLISVDRNGRLVPLPTREASSKLCRVVGKRTLEGGRIQLALHDGKTVAGDYGEVRVGDTLRLSLPGHQVLERIPLQPGIWALVTGGKNVGRSGRIAVVEGRRVELERDGERFQAPPEYVFPVGEKPLEVGA
ncbi:MAG: 30S ribosomal protein S4e [Candidatus Hadarchaeales archaeon]